MSNLTDVYFTISFLTMIGIFLYKLYNIFTKGEAYDLKGVFLLFIGYLLAYLICMISFFSNPEIKLYMILYLLSSFILTMITLFSIVEILFYLAIIGTNPNRSSRFSNRGV